ncbi:hypothetical protein JCM4814A_00910 [Streptomyces phaeofaciens JCM 4814]|uniref:Uncharacterized protein n=1 Tax=Streptomyces phaeofaciens TaxID=68254 RepID=A0A918HPM7_9ACTN|nr:hypothetical protein GCM10010226_82670 [Streptomyces phaeofaciens]
MAAVLSGAKLSEAFLPNYATPTGDPIPEGSALDTTLDLARLHPPAADGAAHAALEDRIGATSTTTPSRQPAG